MKTEKEIKNKLEKFFKTLNLSFEVMDYIYLDELEEGITFDDLTSHIDENNGFIIEYIYPRGAIEYLLKGTNYLDNSLEMAKNLGYSLDKVDSALLATILASEHAREEWYANEKVIEAFLSTLFEE